MALGSGDDALTVAGVWVDGVDAGAGNDTVRAEHLPYEARWDGGKGTDRLELTGDEWGVHLSRDEMSTPERLTGFEQLTTSPQADYVQVRAGMKVFLGDGNDSFDAQNGAEDFIDCGPGEDNGAADPEDFLIRCESVWGQEQWTPIPSEPRVPPPMLVFPPKVGVDLGDGALGLQGTPKLEGDRVSVTIRAYFVDRADLELTVRPWRGDAPTATLPASAPVDLVRGEFIPLSFTVPPELIEVARRDGRLRVGGVLRLRNPAAETTREGRFTLVAPRASRVVLDGRRRKGSFGSQRMRGGRLGDLLSGESADDVLSGFAGTDELHGGTGNDELLGGDGDDLLDGGDGDDTVYGEAGDDDLIEARFGNDTLDGGPGDDVIHGRRGTDTIRGGDGDDVIDGGSGIDRVDCGPGEDIVLVNSRREHTVGCEEIQDGEGVVLRRCAHGGTDAPETVLGTEGDDQCAGFAGDDDLEGRGGDDFLVGGSGNDRIFGRFGADRLLGDDGDDELEGGRGRDRLDGGAGNDQVNGGYGRDRVDGGSGDDRVIARGGGPDRIDCGPGSDVAYVDSRDVVRGCERVNRSGGRAPRR